MIFTFVFSEEYFTENKRDIINHNMNILEKYSLNNKVKIDLFNFVEYKYEVQNFLVPEKFTSTTLSPLNRQMGLNESAHL